ncbi:hypothetical protein [Caulobacter henricii]|uniref:ASCH domain-containing protein n=1 Tax=Caulobacter henricii TaxID=69395 RepID=A0A0P0P1C7_9CAUL|nr:hypothetical protein [Caulobacter henricii]ALL14284.1 hypothetical protein AQ619_13540 [Caulobacter henricii]
MVAYSFKPSFIPAIDAGTKRQTIRLPRKRHARAGEALQFFTGPRMKPVRIGAAVCVAAREVRLDFRAATVTIEDAMMIDELEDLNAFAIRDGFLPPEHLRATLWPWEYMSRWWLQTHPDHLLFTGVLIDWEETFVPAAREIAA